MEKREKTNVMRFLDAKKIAHECYFFDCETAPSGEEVAAILHKDPAQVFKTLVTAGKSGAHYVFMVPVSISLTLEPCIGLHLSRDRFGYLSMGFYKAGLIYSLLPHLGIKYRF